MSTVEEKLKEMQQILREKNKQPIFFVGSGLSRRYIESPNWEELLKQVAKEAKCEKDYKEIKKLCNGENEKIAQELEFYCFRNANAMNMGNKSHRAILRDIIADIFIKCIEKYPKKSTLQKNGQFNKDINSQLENIEYLNDNDCPKKILTCANEYEEISKKIGKYSYSLKNIIEIHELQKINPKAIITTNYDTLLEDIVFQEGCKRHIGQEGFSTVVDDSDDKIDLYKIHGCVTKPDSIIITKEDYDNFFQKSKYLYSKIFTLFWEYPVIFIGYSVSDRNIKDILTVMIEVMSDEDRETFLKRIWVVDFVEHEENECVEDKEIELLNGKKIVVTCFRLKNYCKLYQAINEIVLGQRFGALEFNISKNVIELLIEPLYQQQEKLKVVTRELLQNALDACKKKKVNANIEIKLVEESGNSYLEITDNGIGMNLQGIKENFLTVGKTSKKNNCEGLVGKYGIGILSIFLIGDYAEVYTKKQEGVLLSLKIDNKNDAKRVEWLEQPNPKYVNKDESSYTVVKVKLNKCLGIDEKNYMGKLGLDMYITKPENSIKVVYNDKTKEVPKINKDEWFMKLSDNIKLFKGKWLEIDESELNTEEKELAKLLNRNGLIFYNDMLSPAVFKKEEYKQLNNINIPFVMMEFRNIKEDEAGVRTDLTRSNVQISGDVMRYIARGMYEMEIEKIVGTLTDIPDEMDSYELLERIRNSSIMLKNNVDILIDNNKLYLSNTAFWNHTNIWGDVRLKHIILEKLQQPILYEERSADKSSASDFVESDGIICISTGYIEKYIINATSPQNGLRKAALVKILQHLGIKDVNMNEASVNIWRYVREHKNEIKKAYESVAKKNIIWFRNFDISNLEDDTNSLIIFESNEVKKYLDHDFCEILEEYIKKKSIKRIGIHK